MADSYITKRALASALRELLEETPFEKINVAAICEKCGMNRKSFYYHFRDKYDLVNWIFDTDFIELAKKYDNDYSDYSNSGKGNGRKNDRSHEDNLSVSHNNNPGQNENRDLTGPADNSLYEYIWTFFEELSVYFYENRNFYRKVLKVKGQNSFSEHFREFIRPLFRERLELILGKKDVPAISVDFCTDGIICALERWLMQRNCIPPEELISDIRSLIEAIVVDINRSLESQ